MELIPAIDLRDGRCVRLVQGDFERTTVYGDDPVAMARHWQDAGATRLHIVDLDGAKAGQPTQTAIIARMVRAVAVPVQLGGGLRTAQAVQTALDLGITNVILGTAAATNPEFIAELVAQHGPAISVGIDARNGMVATEGWLHSGAIEATCLAQHMADLGVQRIIYTDISRDGTLSEPNFAATEALIKPAGPAIIASGGITQIEHLIRLQHAGVAGAIVGTALYTGHLDLPTALHELAIHAQKEDL